jgi:hypothetical protein
VFGFFPPGRDGQDRLVEGPTSCREKEGPGRIGYRNGRAGAHELLHALVWQQVE